MPLQLDSIRIIMKDLNLNALIIESGDAHQSEYVAECDSRRSFISGFTGSAGTALICLDKALLWTDGRYFLQASEQLSPDWTLMRMGMPDVPTLPDWLSKNLTEGQNVGVDNWLISADSAKNLKKVLEPSGVRLVPLDSNPVDKVWTDRPSYPFSVMKVHELCFAGVSHKDKIIRVQSYLKEVGAVALVVSMLDEIAWLLNIRGADVAYNPVLVAYVVVTEETAHLFIDTKKIDHIASQHLAEVAVVHEYGEVEAFVATLARAGRVVVDPTQINWKLHSVIGENSVMEKTSPITLPKSLKNEAELAGFRDCHIRDGAALTAFLHWLETTVTDATAVPVTEYVVTQKIEEFRARDPKHVCPSFATIAGYGANGAIIHYKPEEASSATLGTDAPFLLDSGAQYLDGTTDVTRTVHFGTPTEWQRECFTLVLKGHLNIARAVFPEDTVGTRLDSLARLPLWAAGLDYNHGTGHGVGAYLNVHEGPQGISFRVKANETGFKRSMTISNEPGYYEDGAFGIRVESLCITVEAQTSHHFLGKTFCTFETVTMAPIQQKLMKLELLNDAEIAWLNDYHRIVRERLLPVIQERFPESVDYLIRETEPIARV